MQTEGQKMNACAEYADRLVDLSDGELPSDERQLVESHLTMCPGCRAELARLDASLAVLRDAVAIGREGPARAASAGPLVFSHAAADRGGPAPAFGGLVPPYMYLAAALSLMVLLAAGFAAVYFTRNRTPETAQATPGHDAARPKDAGPIEASSQPAVLDEAAVLRQIALIEQQARLQASLDLMPRDPWFAEQRAANEELLAQFKAATASNSQPRDAKRNNASEVVPCEGEPL